MNLPDVFTCYSGLKIDGMEGLCIFLKRYAYPRRYLDMVPKFARPVPQLCMASNLVMDYLLSTLNQPWLSPDNLEWFANAIYQKSGALQNCFGFVDGTLRPVARPDQNQGVLYNGHKKVHSTKFQSVAVPSGLVANLFGPMEGKWHDSSMLAESNLYNQLVQYAVTPNGDPLCIYGDPAYLHRPQLRGPFKGARLTQDEQEWNSAMSGVRVSVQWVFADINCFKFLDFKKNLKIQLGAMAKMYIVCTLLHNARCCLYGSTTSQYFEIEPPSLTEYFLWNRKFLNFPSICKMVCMVLPGFCSLNQFGRSRICWCTCTSKTFVWDAIHWGVYLSALLFSAL